MVSLLPASSPASTTEVFFETEPLTFPPFASIMAEASFREREGSVPVKTKVSPEKRLPFSFFSCFVFTPQETSFSMSFFEDSRENH